jgi:hypothetical protein
MFPAMPATLIMFGVMPMAARGETIGSVTRVETLCGTTVNEGKLTPGRRALLPGAYSADPGAARRIRAM